MAGLGSCILKVNPNTNLFMKCRKLQEYVRNVLEHIKNQ